MKKLEWLPIFNIGVKEIDHEHRQMFDLVVSIRETIERDDLRACSMLVKNFIETTRLHFEKEEEFLVRVGYGNVEKHCKYHEELMSRGKELQANFDKAIEKAELMDCYMEMVSLLIDEIVRGGLEFKSFLDEYRFSSNLKLG